MYSVRFLFALLFPVYFLLVNTSVNILYSLFFCEYFLHPDLKSVLVYSEDCNQLELPSLFFMTKLCGPLTSLTFRGVD